MRSLTGTLTTAQNSNNRYPVASATIRDMRLRFAAYTTQANPLTSDDTPNGDQITTASNKILRAFCDSAAINYNFATPGTPSSFGTPWPTPLPIGIIPVGTQAGIVNSGSTIYIFYIDGSNLHLKYASTTDDGSTWGNNDTGLVMPNSGTNCNIAPVSLSVVYIYQMVGTSTNAHYNIIRAENNSGWTQTQAPFSIFNNNTTAGNSSNFDAVTLSGTDYIFYSDVSRGASKVVSYKDGCWSASRLLMPDDRTLYLVYKATVIQGRIWLTGHIDRNLTPLATPTISYSPTFDCYLYSDNGIDWTCLARDSYLGVPKIRGKLHLPGDGYVYYSGAYTIIRAPATYLIDPAGDPSAAKITVGLGGTYPNDIASLQIDQASAGTAPQTEMALASGDSGYFNTPKNTIVKIGSEVFLKLGYLTTAQPTNGELVDISHITIDSMNLTLGDGLTTAEITGRDTYFAKTKDWSSSVFWEFLSQSKKFDPCIGPIANFSVEDGSIWTTTGANLLSDPSFESGMGGWVNYATGAHTTSTRVRVKTEHNTGSWSLSLNKLDGANTDRWGISQTFTPVANVTYDMSIWVKCSVISGGALSYTFKATNGIDTDQIQTNTDITADWQQISLSFLPTTTAAITMYLYFDDATSGTIYVDNTTMVRTDGDTFSTAVIGKDQILLSTYPACSDFDIRMSCFDTATTPSNTVGMGLVGLVTDLDNYINLQLAKFGNNGYLQLWKRRGGIWILLQQVSYMPGGVLWKTDGSQKYSLRLTHTGGNFKGYIRLSTVAAWGAPLINFTWTDTTDKPCTGNDGTGRIGVRFSTTPLRFHLHGVDQYSTAMCLWNSNDLNWNNMPLTSGAILWDSEKITYGNRTNSGTVDTEGRVFSSCGDTDTNMKNSGDPSYHFTQGGYNWTSYVAMTLVGSHADGDWNNYGLVFPTGNEPLATWLITSSVFNYSGLTYLTTAASGHANTNNIVSGDPSWHVPGGTVTCQIAPAFYNCTRGTGGTTAAQHNENSIAYAWADDVLSLESFEFYDYNEDWNNETLLARIAALAGVTKCQFDNMSTFVGRSVVSNGVYVSDGGFTDWLFNLYYTNDFEIQYTTPVMANGDGNGFIRTGLWRFTIDYDNTNGYVANFQTSGVATESIILNPQPKAATALDIRWVWTNFYCTLYVNRMLAATFHVQTTWTSAPFISLMAKGAGTVTLANVRVPDLYGWREFAQVDEGTSADDAIRTLTQDRPIYQISKSGSAMKFSSYDSRDSLGTLSNSIFTDTQGPTDSEIFTWPRVESSDIIEVVDDTTTNQYGLIHRRLQFQTSLLYGSIIELRRMLRRAQEVAYGRKEEMAGNLAMEIEDKFNTTVTVNGTNITVNQDLIANDIQYSFQPGDLSMTVNARKFVQ